MHSYMCTYKITYIHRICFKFSYWQRRAICLMWLYFLLFLCNVYCQYCCQKCAHLFYSVCLYGCRDGSVCGWSIQSGQLQFHYPCSHKGDFIAVDMCGSVVVSGSHDETVKLWQVSEQGLVIPELSIDVGDRVWALSVQPQGNMCCVGSAGYHQVPPLHVFDMER